MTAVRCERERAAYFHRGGVVIGDGRARGLLDSGAAGEESRSDGGAAV